LGIECHDFVDVEKHPFLDSIEKQGNWNPKSALLALLLKATVLAQAMVLNIFFRWVAGGAL